MTTEEMLLQLIDGQKRTDERLDKLDERLDKMQGDITSIKLEIENVISPAIKTLCEMQLDNSKRLRKLENDMQEFNDQLAIGEVLHGLKENNLI